jgi:ribonuclease D
MFKESISKEELYNFPLRHFEGDILVVDSRRQIKDVARMLATSPVLGFDTETRPSFRKGKFNKVALLQLSTPDRAFLIRVNKVGLPSEIREILSDDRIIKPGVAIHDDIKALRNMKKFDPDGFVDLQDHVRDFGIQNFSLKKLSAIVLGFRISKSQQLSNWEAPVLTEAQKVYAATDAWVALMIYRHLYDN